MVALGRPGSPWLPTLSHVLLLLGVYGLAFSLLLNLGTYKQALWVCALGVAIALADPAARARLGGPVRVMLGFGLIFLAQGWLMAKAPIAGDFHKVLAWAMLASVAVVLSPDRINPRVSHGQAAGWLLILFVAAQFVGYRVVTKEYSAGLFPNIHYLALYAVITLPVLFGLAVQAPSRLRWGLVLALAGDFVLLMKTHSRPGYLALIAAALATVPFLPPRPRLWVLAGVIVVPTVLYLGDVFGFGARVDDLVTHFAEEERPAIWRETWRLQRQSSASQWWFGHGLGQFYRDYLVVPKDHWWRDYYASPHNYVLELLYSHGWTGLAWFLLAYGLLFGWLGKAVVADTDRRRRRIGIALVSIIAAQGVIGFLTVPFFARHNLYPLSLILGAALRYGMEARRRG